MGDPVQIGQELNKAHQPQTDWGLIAATLLLVMLGCFTMYAAEASMGSGSGAGFFSRKLLWSVVGLALGAVLIFLDYRRLRRYSWFLYAGTLVALALALAADLGLWTNLQPRVVRYTPILFAAALAGIFSAWNWESRHALLRAIVLLAAPLLLYVMVSGSFMEALEFAAVFAILFGRSRPHRKQVAAMTGVGLMSAGTVAIKVLDSPYLQHRLMGVLTDPAGAGYMALQSRLALQEAGWWGRGIGQHLPHLPAMHTDLVFAFLVHSLGWVAGAAVCLLILYFLHRLVSASHTVRDPYGANLIAAAGTIFGFRFAWNLLMTIGLLPVAGIDLPFISYGIQGAVQIALVGLVLGVFRRKEIIGTSALPQ